MYLISSIQKKILLGLLSIPVTSALIAQGVAAEKTVASGNNQLATLLVITAIVLAFVIWGMGKVLIELGRQVIEKGKKNPTTLSITLLLGFSLLSQVSFGQAAAVKELPNYGGLSETTFQVFVTVIGIEVIAILFLAFSIKRVYAELLPEKPVEVVKQSALGSWWADLDKKIFTKATPVEKEADVLLDHNYDGIRELDNALPPWWKYGFYITIVVAFVYLLNFHVLGIGKNPAQEYAAEMEKAKMQKELYESKNKDKVDEANVQMSDAAGIKAGEEIFAMNCVACHEKGGAGNVGPNLTDDYWIHKGSLNDIYQSIKVGYPDKGMQSWSIKFNPKEISQLASYVKSLRGTKPANGKLPQGELFVETVAAPATADSAQLVKKDTAAVIKK